MGSYGIVEGGQMDAFIKNHHLSQEDACVIVFTNLHNAYETKREMHFGAKCRKTILVGRVLFHKMMLPFSPHVFFALFHKQLILLFPRGGM